MKHWKFLKIVQNPAEIREALCDHKIVVYQNKNNLFEFNDLFEFYENLSNQIGDWVPMDEDLETGEKTGKKWIEIKYDPLYPSSYRHSSTAQPLHTDGSYESNAPEITFFFCIRAAVMGGATIFFDSEDLKVALKLYDKDLYDKATTMPLTFGKGNDEKTKPVITEDEYGLALTWNYFRTKPNNPDEYDFMIAFDRFLENKVIKGGLCHPIFLLPGDAVFFHDERLLHGRYSFLTDNMEDRYLLKGGLRWTNKP